MQIQNAFKATALILLAMGLGAVVACQSGNSGTQNTVNKAQDPLDKSVDPNCQIGGDSMGPDADSIINGTTLKPGSRLARGMGFLVTENQASGSGELCSSTLIASDLVMTAAHCVTDGKSNALDPAHVAVIFSVDPLCSRLGHDVTSNMVKAAKIVVHPSYSDQVIGLNDVALIFLQSAAPMGTQPLAVSFDQQNLAPPDQVYIAGYGRENDATQGAMVDDSKLRFTQLPVVDPSEQNDPYNGQFQGSQLLTLQNDQGSGGCNGDSGGPALIIKDGVLTQIGILSFVYADKGSEAKCLGRISYTRTSYYGQWIQDNSDGRLSTNDTAPSSGAATSN